MFTFLNIPKKNFLKFLEKNNPVFNEEILSGIEFLKNKDIRTFVTDRDGTVNNYCGRYMTSVQSAYNAIFLSRFAKNKTKNSVILTSAPLKGVGLADISVMPENVFIYAGSKGREYLDNNGHYKNYPIDDSQQIILDELNRRLKDLLKKPQFSKFSLIGSGLQMKFGQTTIARQNMTHSILNEESEVFLKIVSDIIEEIDPKNENFRLKDTGLDIELILTLEQNEAAKDFDKGDGLKFLNSDIPLFLDQGATLVCGDTSDDIKMVEASEALSEKTYTIFVTEDDTIKSEVQSVCPDCLFVSTPDVLVTILNSSSL